VTVENAPDWFEPGDESPYMLRLTRVKRPDLIPAVSHVDATARVQTLRRPDNPRTYDLLRAFEKITGVPMLLNTSLNGHDEPLCETPEDALRFFERAPIDVLVIEDRMLLKGGA
jgi:carbamoyltransferase